MAEKNEQQLIENQPKVYSISELTDDIKSIMEAAFDTIWLEGEISNYKVAASKHAYFVLKDEKAQIRCVNFRHRGVNVNFEPSDGDHVLLHGEVAVYKARGEYQVIVDQMEPRGLGALPKAFEQLKGKLSKEGLFDESAKKPIPPFPWKVGVVTSPTGAVIRDIIHVITRRNPKVSIILNPVKVQGEEAGKEIVNAIKEMNQFQDIDVLIVGRGGGSIEDLWVFNEESVARAIHASRIPVVSAVGHETDFTIADFVSDLRAPTPSAAAEQVTPILQDTLNELKHLNHGLMISLQRLIDSYRDTLRSLSGRRFFLKPLQIIQPASQRLDDLNQRIVRALGQWVIVRKERLGRRIQELFRVSPVKNVHLLKQKKATLYHQMVRQMITLTQVNREKFEGIIKNLNTINPLTILERGYSICTADKTGKAIKSSDQVKIMDSVFVRLAKGKLGCIVKRMINN